MLRRGPVLLVKWCYTRVTDGGRVCNHARDTAGETVISRVGFTVTVTDALVVIGVNNCGGFSSKLDVSYHGIVQMVAILRRPRMHMSVGASRVSTAQLFEPLLTLLCKVLWYTRLREVKPVCRFRHSSYTNDT
jgi:hypothetical protein